MNYVQSVALREKYMHLVIFRMVFSSKIEKHLVEQISIIFSDKRTVKFYIFEDNTFLCLFFKYDRYLLIHISEYMMNKA